MTRTVRRPAPHLILMAALLAIVALLLMADCDRDPGPYNPTGGNNRWLGQDGQEVIVPVSVMWEGSAAASAVASLPTST